MKIYIIMYITYLLSYINKYTFHRNKRVFLKIKVMLQRNCSLVVYLAALKTQSLSHIRIIKKDLRGFLYGK